MICEWEDGAVEVRYGNERMEYEDLVCDRAITGKGQTAREPAQHGRSKPAPKHPWRKS